MSEYNDEIKRQIEAQDISGPPPETEPERQYYFIKKNRQWADEFEKKHGRRPSACLVTMGCQMKTEYAYHKNPQTKGSFAGSFFHSPNFTLSDPLK